MLLIVFSTACSTDEVQIQTLSKFGEEFYFGEKVVVWAGTETNNLANVKYTWECDGGSFSGPQYLFENLWIAPKVPGIYNVKVTAKVGDKISTRETKMKVSYFFFENFHNNLNLSTWASSNATITFDLTKNKAQCVGNSTTSTTGYGNFYRLLPDSLKIPFSILSNAGFEIFRNATSYLQYRVLFKTPDDLATPFIREIRWQFLPKAIGTTKNLKIQFETYQPNTIKSTWNDLLVDGVNPLGAITENSYEDFSLSLAADTIFYAYRNTQLVSSSSAIRTWLRDHPNEHPVVSSVYWTFPSSSTTMWFDNFYIVNDGSILITKPL
jgi:hypothetical protein